MTEPQKQIQLDKIIGYDALYDSLMKCKKNVGWKSTTGYYLHNWNTELVKLEDDLRNGTYKKHKPRYFLLTEPKQREIMSIHFRDRIYLRSFNDNAVYPQITKSLIPDNFACQKGKGTDSARIRFKQFLQEEYRKHGTNSYVLNCDIKGYYPNMSRKYSKEMISGYLDEITNEIIQKELDGHPKERGFNAGEQTIQNIGIAALDKLDHYIKERLRIRGYIRYMDDFKLIHHDKAYLEECLKDIRNILESYEMTLNEKKTFIQPISEKIRFLGFTYQVTKSGKVIILVVPEKIKHEKKKIKRMINLVKQGKLTEHEVHEHFKAVKQYLRFGNSTKLIEKLNIWYKEQWRCLNE